MQLLLLKTSYERIAPRLRAIAPDLDIVTITGADTLEREGKPVTVDQISPDIAWLSIDVMRAGLLPNVLGLLQRLPTLKWMQSFLAGLDNPAFKAIIGRGVRLSKSSAQAVAISEYITAHAFSLLTPIAAQREAQAKGQWKPTPYREISQTRWTLIGFGAIGQEVAKRLRPFGAHLTVVRRNPAPSEFASEVVDASHLLECLPSSDVVVLACSLNEQTRDMANDAFFAAMKKDSILINISRGAVIVDDALRRGLDRGQPGRAVLDVFRIEPLPADNWMWTHPQIHVSAHTSPNGSGTPGRGDELFLDNLKRYLAGDKLLNEAHKSEVGL